MTIDSAAQAPPRRRAKEAAPATPCIVGIGASAGGLEAICEFFGAMPDDSGLAFVIVQHLSPTQKSLAAEIIGKHTAMSVQQASEGVRLEANRVYTLPANTYASIHGGCLHLGVPDNARGPRLPIDHFFAALGEDQHERAIGIVLSGSGGDGSQGLRSIVENGGIVLVQTPQSCEFDSMPRSAIATGLVSQVLAVGQMPASLLAYASHAYVADPLPRTSAKEGNAAIEEILRTIQNLRGYCFGGYKRNTLLRRAQRRMSLHSVADVDAYVALLKRDPKEVEALFKDLLIGVTAFFRDEDAWRLAEKEIVVPLVDARPDDEPIRVWVPGCSTGEEAYSIAILLTERLRATGKNCPLQVFATDTNEDALEVGRRGCYPASIAERIPPELLARYFVEDGEAQRYQVSRKLRETLIFGKQNLLRDPPFSGIALICCRNLLIYLDPESQRKVISIFHFALQPGGYLFLGNAETVGRYEDVFRPLARKWRLYRHTGGFTPNQLEFPIRESQRTPDPLPTAGTRYETGLPGALAGLTQQLILERFSPAAVLINARFEALYYSGPTEEFLQMPRGAPTHDLLAQIRDGLRSRLRSAVREAIAGNACVVVDNARVWRGNTFEAVRFSVLPAGSNGVGDPLLLVVFENVASAPSPLGSEGRMVRQLEDELQATKEDLQSAIEQLETSNEDLKISNEEIISINEELHSINAELENSKEDLQSLNEELKLVNRQLQTKVGELEASTTDIRNLLASSEIATLCIDRGKRIKWFSPGMGALCNIMAADIGRSVDDLAPGGFGEALAEDIETVLRTLAATQRELRSPNGHWYLRRSLPYRTENDRIDGVIINYTDISEARKQAEEIANAQRSAAGMLEEQVRLRTAQLRTLMAELGLIEERERRILAQDLHDGLGQLLAIVKIKLTSLEDSERRGTLKKPLKEIEDLIDQSNRSVRSLMQQLSPPVLETLGLIPALEWLAEEMERSYGLSVRIDVDGPPPVLEEPARTTTFRVLRELLINVAKHAGTNLAQIDCQQDDDGRLTLSVTDQGKGFDYEKALSGSRVESGFGLVSARERIEFVGGQMNVDTQPGYGATVSISFPNKAADI